jgi:flagellin-specific chaperone FliS
LRQLDYYVEIYEDLQKFYKQKKQALVKHNLDKLFLKIDETEKLLETKKDEIDAYLKKHEKEFASKVFKN